MYITLLKEGGGTQAFGSKTNSPFCTQAELQLRECIARLLDMQEAGHVPPPSRRPMRRQDGKRNISMGLRLADVSVNNGTINKTHQHKVLLIVLIMNLNQVYTIIRQLSTAKPQRK